MMWIFLCAFLSLCSSFPIDLIPEDDDCADVMCPKLNCTNVIKKEGECCNSCTIDLIPEDDKCADVTCPKLNCTNTTSREGECCMSCITAEGCLYGGEHYEELTLVPMNQSDPCTACFCFNGNITCENISESCPKLKCNQSQQIEESGKCCPRCSNENLTQDVNSSCKENGITYQEDDIWNPYYVQFGIVKCLNCTCENGTVQCGLSPCPPVKACTPDDPVEEETYCCPKCNRTLETNGSIPYTPPDLNPSAPPKSNATCLTVNPHKVYETVNKEIDQVAIENITSSRVRVHVWLPELPSAFTETYSSEDFTNNILDGRFKFIGNATAESVQTFHKWLEIEDRNKSIAYCKANCSMLVINLLLQSCN